MSWFDGTFACDYEEIREKFPVYVTDRIRINETGDKFAVINDYEEDSVLYALSDPHREYDEPITFYHIFEGTEAERVKEFIGAYVARFPETPAAGISLYRVGDAETFMYSYAGICVEELGKLPPLPDGMNKKDVFALPMRLYKFACPVCGHRTLDYRGMCLICDECGWEDDDREADEDGEGICNGDWTIGEYREWYLKQKQKDPTYSQWGECEKNKEPFDPESL